MGIVNRGQNLQAEKEAAVAGPGLIMVIKPYSEHKHFLLLYPLTTVPKLEMKENKVKTEASGPPT